MFAAERALGTAVLNDWYATNKPGSGQMPQAPADWQDLLAAIEKAHTDYRAVVESFSEAQLMENVKFFSAPKTMGDYQRIGFMWFLLSDQIHHRGSSRSAPAWPTGRCRRSTGQRRATLELTTVTPGFC
jgi:hypothetical protein